MVANVLSLRLLWWWALLRARVIQLRRAAGWRRDATYVWQRVDEHRARWQAAATTIGAAFTPLSDEVWVVTRGEARTVIANDRVQIDDPVLLAMAGDKELCYRLAAGVGVSVPEHDVFDRGRLDAAWRYVQGGGHLFVAKPARDTSSGIGVTVGIRTRRETVVAFATAAIRDRRVIIERFVPGETCRLLFLDGALLHAVRRRGVRLRSDGVSTIGSLLTQHGHDALLNDRLTAATLAGQGMDFETVAPTNAEVVVRGQPLGHGSSEVRTIYDEAITDRLSPELVNEARRVVAALGSAWAGVDIVTLDPSRPLRECGAFLEINTTPGILHHGQAADEPADVAVPVLERLLAAGDDHRPAR